MLDEKQIEKAEKLRRSGWSDPQIAEALGVRPQEVWYWRTKNNLRSGFRMHPVKQDGRDSCKYADQCFSCKKKDCHANGTFPMDEMYNEMVRAGMTAPDPIVPVLKEMNFGRTQENPFPKRCLSCQYRRPLHSSVHSSMRVCYYCLDNDEPRGCSVQECAAKKIHYEKRKREK